MIAFTALLALLHAQHYVYSVVDLEGWTVHVEKKIIDEHPKLWTAARNELQAELQRIEKVVPDGPLKQLKTVPFWMHLDNPVTPGAAFHPGKEWLIEHGQDPDMVKGIELGNAEHLVTWPVSQPWMVMHELAHAYHNLFLKDGFDNSEVLATYKSAVDSHKYENVLYFNGTKKRAYGLNNAMEYFSETTEAYLGQNDFYPFVQAELKEFDPAGFELMKKIWGNPVPKLPRG